MSERYLLDALGLFRPDVVASNRDSLVQLAEFLDHNELGLAFDCLYSIASENQWNSVALLEKLALAASNMELRDQAQILGNRVKSLQSSEQGA